MSKLVKIVLVVFCIWIGLASSTIAQQSKANNSWYVLNDSDTVFIFVHGIFSSSETAYLADNKTYWPDLLSKDIRFSKPSIYLGGYYTDFSSGVYKINDAAAELLRALTTTDAGGKPAPISKQKIIFIAHSTGGLVVRYMLESNFSEFANKKIGLVLMASPSKGSEWADRLGMIRKTFKNQMAGQLERDNAAILDLDGRFQDFISKKRIPQLVGKDAFESKFIIPGVIFNNVQIVNAENSTSYFGRAVLIPDTDHFTIVKPTDVNHPSHRVLASFIDVDLKRAWATNTPPPPTPMPVPIQITPTITAKVVCNLTGFESFATAIETNYGASEFKPKFNAPITVAQLSQQKLPTVLSSDGQICMDAIRLTSEMHTLAIEINKSLQNNLGRLSAYDQALIEKYIYLQKRLIPLLSGSARGLSWREPDYFKVDLAK